MTYDAQDIPNNHPVKKHFRTVADRALTQSSIPDKDLLLYLSDMLTHFMYVDNLYPLKDQNGERLTYLAEMLEVALEAPRSRKKEFYQQIGDHTLFILGMFPESLTAGVNLTAGLGGAGPLRSVVSLPPSPESRGEVAWVCPSDPEQHRSQKRCWFLDDYR